MASTFLYDDIDHWTAAVARLNAELESRQENGLFAGAGAARILLTGSPPALPGLKVPLLIEEAGAVIVAPVLLLLRNTGNKVASATRGCLRSSRSDIQNLRSSGNFREK